MATTEEEVDPRALNTPKLALPYPVGTDTADIPRDIQALATRVDTVTGAAGGIAQLDGGAKVPVAQLPTDVASGVPKLDPTVHLPPAVIGTGARDGTRFLRDDGTWQVVQTTPPAGSITSGMIADGTIVGADLAAGAVGSREIADASIVGGDLAAGAVGSREIADGSIVGGDIAANQITSGHIVDGTLVGADHAAGAIGSREIADASIVGGDLAAGTIGSREIADGSIAGGDIAANQIVSAHIVDGTIVGGDLAAGTLTARELAGGSVGSAQIVDGTIVGADMAAGAVTTREILDGTIVGADLAAGAVGSREVADASLVGGDLAAGTIGTREIADGSILGSDLAPGAGGGMTVASQATSFPTSGLFNGYRFTLMVPANGIGGYVTWDFIYRADLDGTYPWHAVGGPQLGCAPGGHVNSDGGYGFYWLNPQVTAPRAGYYEGAAYGIGFTSPNGGGGASIRFIMGGATFGGSAWGNQALNAYGGCYAQLAAGGTCGLQGSSSAANGADYNGTVGIRPMRLA